MTPLIRFARLVLPVLAGALVAATPAAARAPVVSYVDPVSGEFALYDLEAKQNRPAPDLDVGGAVKRFAASQNGRYFLYRDSDGRLRLWDQAMLVDVALPGVDVVAAPDGLTVSDAGLIGFDDNGNGPVRIYNSVSSKFVSHGLGANNGHRQPRLSADGRWLATTCVSNCVTPPTSGADAYLQDLSTRTPVPFPDDLAGSDQRDEEHPCINRDGSLVALNITNPMQTDVFMLNRTSGTLVPLPGINDPAENDFNCVLDSTGSYIGFSSASGFRVYRRPQNNFLNLPDRVRNAVARPSDGSLSDLFTELGAAGPRRPVIAYVDAATGRLGLYDSQLGLDLPRPPLPANLPRWAVSLDGRYVTYVDPVSGNIRLLDRTTDTHLPLPGIDVYANPGGLNVSNSGRIAFDDNGNGPTLVYRSAQQSFLPTGLPDGNGHRQPRLSGDGLFLASTCIDGLNPCVDEGGGDSDVFVQNLTTAANVPFPDDLSGSDGRDEDRPCVNKSGSLVGFQGANPVQRDVFVYNRSAGALVALPGMNDPVADDLVCVMDSAGDFIGSEANDGTLKVYSRAGRGFLLLPDRVGSPVWFAQPTGGTARVNGSQLTFTAGLAAANRVTVSLASGAYTLVDAGAPVSPGPGCVRVRYDTVSCAAAGITSIAVDARDQADRVTVTAATPALVVGGPGPDILRGGPAADSLRGAGENDQLFARDGVADIEVDCGAGAGDRAEVDAGEGTAGCETVTEP